MSEPDWLTQRGVARLKGCARETVRVAIRAGELRATFHAYLGLRLVRRADAMAWEPRKRGETRKAREGV